MADVTSSDERVKRDRTNTSQCVVSSTAISMSLTRNRARDPLAQARACRPSVRRHEQACRSRYRSQWRDRSYVAATPSRGRPSTRGHGRPYSTAREVPRLLPRDLRRQHHGPLSCSIRSRRTTRSRSSSTSRRCSRRAASAIRSSRTRSTSRARSTSSAWRKTSRAASVARCASSSRARSPSTAFPQSPRRRRPGACRRRGRTTCRSRCTAATSSTASTSAATSPTYFRQLGALSSAARLDFRSDPLPGPHLRRDGADRRHERLRPEMLHAAAKGQPYKCFVGPDAKIPFMAMPDAVTALRHACSRPTARSSPTVGLQRERLQRQREADRRAREQGLPGRDDHVSSADAVRSNRRLVARGHRTTAPATTGAGSRMAT